MKHNFTTPSIVHLVKFSVQPATYLLNAHYSIYYWVVELGLRDVRITLLVVEVCTFFVYRIELIRLHLLRILETYWTSKQFCDFTISHAEHEHVKTRPFVLKIYVFVSSNNGIILLLNA